MATITPKLDEIATIVYNGSECKRVKFGNHCTWAQIFDIRIPSFPTGVSSLTISCTSTQATLGKTGTLHTSLSGGGYASAYHGDKISVSGSAKSGFPALSISPSSFEVTDDYNNISISSVSFTVDKVSYSVVTGGTWQAWAGIISAATVEYGYVLHNTSNSPICTLDSTKYSWNYISPSATITAGDYYTVGGLTDYNITGGSSGGTTPGGGTTPDNPGTGGGTTSTVSLTLDGMSFTAPANTTWGQWNGNGCPYTLYNFYGDVTPVGSGGPPWLIDELTDNIVQWTDVIKNNGRYSVQ